MSTTIAEQSPAIESDDQTSRVGPWIALFAGLAIVVGGLAAVFWSAIVDLPAYRIAADGTATMTERGLVEIVSADAWFVITGALVGAGLGLVAWTWFRPIGWPSVVIALGGGLLAAVVCWQIGQLLGPGPEAERLAAARAGELVPVSLELRSLSALAVWAFAAVTPVLLWSALGPDDEDSPPRRGRGRFGADGEQPEVDERGVLTATEEAAE